jgi:hypothetical protein|tara:strand:- start:17 stop:418 length:402 start_codon:yes stop_codon:yes gene_type:complete
MENKKATTAKKILDTVVISSLTSLIASIVGGVAFYVYSQAQTATEDIRDIKSQLKTIHQDIEKTNEAIVEEIAPLKAEHAADDKKFDEITKFLQNNMGGFELPKPPTYQDINKEREDLKGQFNTTQQQSLPRD